MTRLLVSVAVLLFVASFYAANWNQGNPAWVFTFTGAILLLMQIPPERQGSLRGIFRN